MALNVKTWLTVFHCFTHGMLSSSSVEYSFKCSLRSTCDSFFIIHLNYWWILVVKSYTCNHKTVEFSVSSQASYYKLVGGRLMKKDIQLNTSISFPMWQSIFHLEVQKKPLWGLLIKYEEAVELLALLEEWN